MKALLIKVLVCFVAGAGAGIGTGFAGMSAAVVISPMLITFLGVEAYEAVGIALASDVLASALSAWIYHKHGNLDIKDGVVMLITVLIFTLIGSLVSSLMPDATLGSFSLLMTVFLGIKFLVKPTMTSKEESHLKPRRQRIIRSIICGCYVGFVCGFIGAGGGLMILFVLTSILGYDLKTAVGTSVFIMSFTALTGAVSHFALGGLTDVESLVFCIVFTLIWARIAARYANKAAPKTLNVVTGTILCVLGVAMIAFNYFF